MSHIVSYVKRQKENTFFDVPFNEVDALVLSQFIYLKLDGLIPTTSEKKEAVYLYEIANNLDYEKVFMDERYRKNNTELFEAMVESKRFRRMKMNYFSDITSVLAETQFSAMTVFLEGGPNVVIYRGTDETMVGWKEDFNMIFKEPVTGQSLSAMYLQQVSEQLEGDFIVTGHSKGGNFAIYASMNVEDKIQDRIDRVYSFDSPGFRPEILESVDFNKIKDRIIKYLPHSSIFGMLLQSKENYQIVECFSIGVLQHNPYNWRISGNEFKKVDKLGRSSVFLNETYNEWLYGLSDEELQAYSEIWYKIMQDANITTMLQFTKEPGKALISLIDAIKETDDKTKEMAKDLAHGLIEVAKENIRYYAKKYVKIKDKNDPIKKDIKNVEE
ncbi:MAG: DUF2974 domain-containing protein [Lachnospiraceae bacterium]|nr:DUF2974 domain-containing protein [Lachnospiraceae bacterium]